jgi:transcriptional regulator of acetoin/glycerol metabolism
VVAKCEENTIREKDICRALPEAAVFNTSVARSVVGAYGTSLIMSERQRFEKAIIKCRGNRDEAAKALGLSRATFFRRAKDLGLVRVRENSTSHSYLD